MSDAPAVSVIISTLDRRLSLLRSLDSLEHQTVPAGSDYEIIIVDNGCTDGTRDAVELLIANGFTRLRYVREPRRGVSYGRNAGIAAARAPILAFTDDDNIVASDWVATIQALFDRHPDVAAVGGRIVPEWPTDVPVPPWLDRQHWPPIAILDYGDQPFYTSANDPRCLLTANLAVRREVLERLGGFSPLFLRCQDHELLLRLWRAGERALYAPELVVRAAVEPERLTIKYHRAWHVRHGRYSALMRTEDMIDKDGRVRLEPSKEVYQSGVPPHIYAELARAICGCVAARLQNRRALALRREFHVGYLLGYVRRTIEMRRPLGPRVFLERFRSLGRTVRSYARSASVSMPRLLLVHAIVGALVGGSLYDIRTGREHWPLSPYPMFSIVEKEPSLRCLRIVGVTAAPKPEELVLLEPALIHPFDQCRLTSALSRTYHDVERRHLIQEQLRDCLNRYEARRRAGEHGGPPLSAVRLYEMYWTLDDNAANVTTPDSRRLIDTVAAAPAAGS